MPIRAGHKSNFAPGPFFLLTTWQHRAAGSRMHDVQEVQKVASLCGLRMMWHVSLASMHNSTTMQLNPTNVVLPPIYSIRLEQALLTIAW